MFKRKDFIWFTPTKPKDTELVSIMSWGTYQYFKRAEMDITHLGYIQLHGGGIRQDSHFNIERYKPRIDPKMTKDEISTYFKSSLQIELACDAYQKSVIFTYGRVVTITYKELVEEIHVLGRHTWERDGLYSIKLNNFLAKKEFEYEQRNF